MSHNYFIDTKPSKLFFKTAIPGGISMVASSLYCLFESVIVGKVLGKTAFAAISFAFPFVLLNFAFSELIGVGASVAISIFLGQKEDDKANNYFSCAILLTIITGVLSGLFLYLAAPFLLSMLGATAELIDEGVKYLKVYAIFSPITPLMFSLDNYLRISKKVKSSMSINIFFSLFTLILEWIFIKFFVKDLAGVAIGTCIAMIICVVIMLMMFVPGKLQLKFVKPRLNLSMIKQIYKNGIAPFLTNISGRIFSFIMNRMLIIYGGEAAVATYGIVMTLCGVTDMLIYGTLDSLQPVIGYNYGAKRYDRVKVFEKYLLITAGSISIFFGVLIFLFPEASTLMFLEDISLLDMSVHAVKIGCIAFLFKWFASSVQCFFMALEKPLWTMIISISSACAFPLLLILILLPFELSGLWWNYSITALLSATLAFIILKKKNKTLFR